MVFGAGKWVGAICVGLECFFVCYVVCHDRLVIVGVTREDLATQEEQQCCQYHQEAENSTDDTTNDGALVH